MRVSLIAAIVGLLLAEIPAAAHHSFAAEFDINKPVQLTGTVTAMEWVNPHSWIHLDVKGPDGKVSNWRIEGSSPGILLRRGFTKQALEPGTVVVVNGYQAKSGENRMNGGNITFPDGRRLFLSGSNPDERPHAEK